MTIKSFAFAGLSSLLLVAGCGSSDDSKPAAAEGTPNKSGASSATTSTITAVQTAIKPSAGGAPGDSGQASANQLASAAQATQNLVTPSAGGAGAKSLPGLELIGDLLHPLAPPAGQTGTCTCTADSCTFAACSNGSVTMDGTYSFGSGKIKATGLKYTINVGGAGASAGVTADVVITIDADITATATSINGSFHSAGSTNTSAGGQTYSTWDSTLEFKNVTFPSGGGAATGGSEHVSATTNVTAGGASQAYQSNFDVTFPAN